MSRKLIGDHKLTNAERQRRYRERKKAQGQRDRRIWINVTDHEKSDRVEQATVDDPVSKSAAEIARERFTSYVTEILKGEWDTTQWEYWTFLLDQAKSHEPDHSGFGSIAYQRDRDAARPPEPEVNPKRRRSNIQRPDKTRSGP